MENTMSRRSPDQMAARRDRSGSLWLIQAVTGILLVALLGIHMIAHHYIVEGGLRDYQQVLDYVANPIIFTIEVLFVVVVTIHALLGVRAIINDLRPSASALRVTNWILAVVGGITIAYGLYLALTLQRMAG